MFGVWNDCKVYMSNSHASSDLDLIFMVQWSKLNFCGMICFLGNIRNWNTVIGVWNDCKVYMSSWQVSSDLDLIFMVQWSKLSFWVLVFFLILYAIGQLNLVYGNILWSLCQSRVQVLFDRDLILTVHCTVLSFCVLVYFS